MSPLLSRRGRCCPVGGCRAADRLIGCPAPPTLQHSLLGTCERGRGRGRGRGGGRKRAGRRGRGRERGEGG